MSEPITGHCTCDEMCPGAAHCACILVPFSPHATAGDCTCICSHPEVATIKGDEAVQNVALDQHVNMQMHDASLGEAGKLLAEVAEAKIFVPADRIDERRDLYLQDVSLEAVIGELGLMAEVRP
jgi:hypothetical protein